MSPPIARTQMLIRRPVGDVFQAWIDPAITTRFWFNRSSGPLSPGATVTWYWDVYGASAAVTVVELQPDQRIQVHWPTPVIWTFESRSPVSTLVTITASDFSGSPEQQVAQAIDAMGGFSYALAGCKAWLEHGIPLELVRDHSPDHHVVGSSESAP